MSPKRKAIRNFSASQIQAFVDCPRYWLQKWILGERTPDTPAQIRGKAIHAVLEEYFKTGKLDETHPLGYHRYIQWLFPVLPDPNKERVKPEFKLFLDAPSGKVISGYGEAEGVPLVGIIDALFQRDLLNLGDLKTVTDLRNAKTPAELYADTQMNTYAKWAFGVDESLKTIHAEHWYVLVSAGNDKDGNPKQAVKNPKSNKILRVGVDLSRDSVERIWDRDCETMEKMKVASLVESFEELEPNPNFCPMYGGCDFKAKCNITNKAALFAGFTTLTKKGKTDMAGFLDKVNTARAAQGKEAASTDPKVQAKDEDEGDFDKAKSKVAAAAKKRAAAKEDEPKKEEAETNKGAEAPKVAGGSWKDRLKKKPVTVAKSEKPAEKADSEASEPDSESLTPPDGADRKTSSAEEEGLRLKAAKALEKKEAKKAAAEAKAKAKAEGKEHPKTTRNKTKSKRGFTLYVGCMPAKGEHQNFELIEDWTTGFDDKDSLSNAIDKKIEQDGIPLAIVSFGHHPAVKLLINHATDVVHVVQTIR